MSWFEKLLYIYQGGGVIFILFGPSIGFGRHGYNYRPQKHCYSNIRVLQGAVEMYNMDNPSNMMDFLDINRLVNSKYLKEPPESPIPCCRYSENGRLSDDDGEVVCAVHGGMITSGPYDKDDNFKCCDKCSKFLTIKRYKSEVRNRVKCVIIWPLITILPPLFDDLRHIFPSFNTTIK